MQRTGLIISNKTRLVRRILVIIIVVRYNFVTVRAVCSVGLYSSRPQVDASIIIKFNGRSRVIYCLPKQPDTLCYRNYAAGEFVDDDDA